MTYITAIHVPVAGLALLPLLIGLRPMLYPMHLVLLEPDHRSALLNCLRSRVQRGGCDEEAAA